MAQPLHPGTEFTVLERLGDWLHVQLDNGTQGWFAAVWLLCGDWVMPTLWYRTPGDRARAA